MIKLLLLIAITNCISVGSISIYIRESPGGRFLRIRSTTYKNTRGLGTANIKCGVDSLDDVYFGCDLLNTTIAPTPSKVTKFDDYSYYDDILDETSTKPPVTTIKYVDTTTKFIENSIESAEHIPKYVESVAVETDLSEYDDMLLTPRTNKVQLQGTTEGSALNLFKDKSLLSILKTKNLFKDNSLLSILALPLTRKRKLKLNIPLITPVQRVVATTNHIISTTGDSNSTTGIATTDIATTGIATTDIATTGIASKQDGGKCTAQSTCGGNNGTTSNTTISEIVSKTNTSTTGSS